MRIACIADTHGRHKHVAVPDGDILLFAGDFTGDHRRNAEQQLNVFNKWLGNLPHEHKVVIAGNHDFYCQENHDLTKAMFTSAVYLCDDVAEVGGLKIWGSPFTPPFLDWAFMAGPDDMRRRWSHIPDDVDVLITHGPPYGILDLVSPKFRRVGEDPHVGCRDLGDALYRLSNLKLHVFGHIHESYGTWSNNGVQFVNASNGYRPVNNPPIVVDL